MVKKTYISFEEYYQSGDKYESMDEIVINVDTYIFDYQGVLQCESYPCTTILSLGHENTDYKEPIWETKGEGLPKIIGHKILKSESHILHILMQKIDKDGSKFYSFYQIPKSEIIKA